MLAPANLYFFKIKLLGRNCNYQKPAECRQDEYCIFLKPGESRCVPSERAAKPKIIFPKDPKNPTICTQGSRTAMGRTHTYLNTAFAVDLASPPKAANARIRAVFNGQVWTHTGCDNQDNKSFHNDSCGQGFGNWVVILQDSSELIAFYAHLRSVLIKNGTRVQVGDTLGEEGKTGAAGHRHLHFSVHKNIWKSTLKTFEENGIWLPPSIPFEVSISGKSGAESVSVENLPCQDSNDLVRLPFFGSD